MLFFLSFSIDCNSLIYVSLNTLDNRLLFMFVAAVDDKPIVVFIYIFIIALVFIIAKPSC